MCLISGTVCAISLKSCLPTKQSHKLTPYSIHEHTAWVNGDEFETMIMNVLKTGFDDESARILQISAECHPDEGLPHVA